MKKKAIAALTIAGLMALQMPITALADVTTPIKNESKTVNENITVNGIENATAILLNDAANPYSVTVNGNVTGNGFFCPTISVSKNSGNNVTVTGTVANGGGTYAIEAKDGATIQAGSAVTNSDRQTVKSAASTVVVEGTVINNGTGTALYAEDGSTVTAGNVEAVVRGVDIRDSQATVGDVTVKGTDTYGVFGACVSANNSEKNSTATIGKIDVTSTTDKKAIGLNAYVTETKASAEVQTKDITVTGKEGTRAVQLDIFDNADATSEIFIYVDGNVTSTDEGVYVYASSGKATLIVDGTISGENYAIVENADNALKNTKIYAYEVKTSETGTLFGKHTGGNPDGVPEPYKVEADEDLAKSINYIIKTTGGNFESIDGGILERFEVDGEKKSIFSATENTKIVVKAASGYEVKAGTLLVTKEADGSYSVIVPRGGGVTLETIKQAIQQAEEEAKVSFTGNVGNPVMNGQWNMGPGGTWTYRTNGLFRNTWAYIGNPYANAGQAKEGWFYFDKNGIMLTGWQTINDKEYYFNEAHDGTYGMMLANTTTPDGKRVGADGARIQ